uniref:Uncharacterized protein n=1 Tax=Siphoviridae sp. ctgaY24 TaxID=2827911 RepID=A0A8S5SAN3_9CAUD|nr:MAG TPA: hypothetical protein [Siphoviridae sp. ctgaY24]
MLALLFQIENTKIPRKPFIIGRLRGIFILWCYFLLWI